MFVIVALSVTDREETPGPVYSTTLPTPPFTVSSFRTFNMTSLAEDQGFNEPFSLTFTTLGTVKEYVPLAIATATSKPPAPIAIIPRPPPVGV